MNNWKERVALNYLVLVEMEKADKEGLWDYYYPELRCSEEQIQKVEKKLGFTLNEGYRQLILCINGWNCFHQNIDLFQVEELLGSKRMDYANMLLDVIYNDGVPPEYNREDLMPIAADMYQPDVFALILGSSKDAGRVLWLGEGELIDNFESVSDFFETMIELNKEEVLSLKKENGIELDK